MLKCIKTTGEYILGLGVYRKLIEAAASPLHHAPYSSLAIIWQIKNDCLTENDIEGHQITWWSLFKLIDVLWEIFSGYKY